MRKKRITSNVQPLIRTKNVLRSKYLVNANKALIVLKTLSVALIAVGLAHVKNWLDQPSSPSLEIQDQEDQKEKRANLEWMA